ncbi:helix-turn-helix domain-containing protein [Ruminococcus sp.]|uniref:TetR/AcrR family transcriptional regulator n=1 Tax=Ruminococcus sp. TaxID=41978 RepID=UPI0025F92AE6|nr:helix-turn-helix domain-containing protein [Ruminococcus sp.]MBQ8966502.1 helix-turn-helix transcriptional regulator [Ruminococcus sp.]
MPRDKRETHEKMIPAAMAEFLEYGFEKASMRRIAASLDMTAAALYRHFDSKEAMFAALVEPVVTEFTDIFKKLSAQEFADIETEGNANVWQGESDDSRWVMRFIYEHFDVFTLLVCKSQGTRYESFVHDVAVMEERTTMRYFEALRSKGVVINEIDPEEFHVLVSTNVGAIFEAVRHGFSEEKAMHYAVTLDRFFTAAWKDLIGI